MKCDAVMNDVLSQEFFEKCPPISYPLEVRFAALIYFAKGATLPHTSAVGEATLAVLVLRWKFSFLGDK